MPEELLEEFLRTLLMFPEDSKSILVYEISRGPLKKIWECLKQECIQDSLKKF